MSLKRKLSILIILILYTALIFIPPIAYGYIYPNNGDDSGNHLLYFNAVAMGKSPEYDYVGQLLLGKVLVATHNLTGISINNLFLWFNFFILWLIGIVGYIVVGGIFGWFIGLLAIPIVMFVSPSVLNLYDTGAIFDLMTVAIIVPILLFGVRCFVKGNRASKIVWGSVIAVAFGFGFGLHSMAIFMIDVVTKEKPEIIPTPMSFIGVFLGVWMLILLLLSNWSIYKEKIKIGNDLKYMLWGFLVLFLGLSIFSFTKLTIIPVRFAIDMAILASFFTAILCVMVVKYGKLNYIKYMIYGVTVIASLFSIFTYVGYNSAVKPIDEQVMSYTKELSGEYFACSSEVAPWIYANYIDKEYKNGVLPFIERSEPMTAKTNPNTDSFWITRFREPFIVIQGDGETFTDNNLEIKVIQ